MTSRDFQETDNSALLAHPLTDGGRWWRMLALGLSVLVTLAAYSNSITGTYVFDDISEIRKNPGIRQLWPPERAMFEGTSMPHRPVPYYSFAVNYAISGVDVWSYHLFNLGVHLAAGLVLFGIVRRTLVRLSAPYARASGTIALAVASIWLVHPLGTQAVTYIYQRMESLMALCYLLTLYTFLRAVDSNRPWIWYVLSIVSCAAGMGCKEVMITAPMAVFWYDRVFVARSFREMLTRRWGYYVALASTWLLLYAVLRCQVSHYGEFSVTNWSASEYLINQSAVLCRYLQLCFWPRGQCFDYLWMPANHWTSLVVPGAIIATLLGLALVAMWRRPPLGFLLGMFFLILAPTSSLLPINDMAVEHRMYLPLAVVIVASMIGVYEIWRRLSPVVLPASATVRGTIGLSLLFALIATLGVVTFHRNALYSDYKGLWSDSVDKAPWNRRAWRVVGQHLHEEGRDDELIARCRHAVRGLEDQTSAHLILGEMLTVCGRQEDAIREWFTALEMSPDLDEAHYNLGNVLLDQGDVTGAIERFRKAIEQSPKFIKARHGLGKALAVAGKSDEAIVHLREAAKLDAECEAGHDLGVLLCDLGRYEEAAVALRKFLVQSPDHLAARECLGQALMTLGDFSGAEEAFRQSLRLDPENAGLLQQWAGALFRLGRREEACQALADAVKLSPDDAQARLQWANCLVAVGRLKEAMQQYDAALQLNPELEEAQRNGAVVRARLKSLHQ